MKKSFSVLIFMFLGSLLFLADAKATTIYFAGGQDIDFITNNGTSAMVNSAGTYRTNFSLGSIDVSNCWSSTNPPANSIITPAFSAQSTIWIHAVANVGTSATTAGLELIRVFGSDGNPRVVIRATGSAGQLKISTRNTAGTLTDVYTCTGGTYPLLGLHQLDVALNYAASGSITLYVDTASFCTYSGDLTTNGITTVNQVEFDSSPANCTHAYWSEIIVADSDTRTLSLMTLAPVAAGTTQEWSGAVVGNISKLTISDLTYNSTNTANQISDWTIPALPNGNWSVVAVKQVARLSAGSSPANAAFSCRPNGQIDQFSSSFSPLGFANFSTYWANNCATASAWTASDLSGANFGVESLP